MRRIMAEHPEADQILPTRLGNVIRSFEFYPTRQYGISAIPLWPRFAAKIKSEHAAILDDAKTSFDAVIHFSFLSFVLAGLLLLVGCLFPVPLATWRLFARWIGAIAVSTGLGWIFYRSSIARASEWGDLVRGVFDLYRADVLRDLGFDRTPGDLASERALWRSISVQIIFGDPVDGVALRFRTGTMILPDDALLIPTRAVGHTSKPDVWNVCVRIRNDRDRGIDGIEVVEHLESGFQFVYDSANLPVRGTNPYYFSVGSLQPNDEAVVRYRIMQLKSS
jgi:hypothetical protein